jgi:hypothetical protein
MKLALLAALAAALAVPAAEAATAGSTLNGTVGPGFSISLTQGGKKVSKLKAGSYKLVVKDKASIHDFHLTGPGLNKVVTSVGFVGSKTITVKLKAGKYTYVCDPHASSMRGSFSVS